METDSFETFWRAYPKKVGKFYAEICWRRVKGEKFLIEILSAIENWKANPQWRDPQFIPNPSTFLNQHRWEDEVPVRSSSQEFHVETHQELYERALEIEKRRGAR